jgi:hypothetical protein
MSNKVIAPFEDDYAASSAQRLADEAMITQKNNRLKLEAYKAFMKNQMSQ